MPTMNGNEMLNALSSALLQLKQHEKSFFEKHWRPFRSGPGSPMTTSPVSLPWNLPWNLPGYAIRTGNVLRFMAEVKKDLVFMFDEFQQISQYPEKNMEHLLRTIIQSYPAIPFIFSGSSKHMLEPMFSAANRPFYQSANCCTSIKYPTRSTGNLSWKNLPPRQKDQR